MTVVVKIGGSIVKERFLDAIASDIATLQKETSFIIVHGGGRIVSHYAERMGVTQNFVTSPSGVRSRYTDHETRDICLMTLSGLVNTEIVQALGKHNVKAVGLNGADARLIRAERRRKIIVVQQGRKVVLDGGFSGKASEINIGLLNLLLEEGIVPTVAPLGLDEESSMVNMDADSVASALALAIKADTLIFLTDVDGVLVDGNLVRRIEEPDLDKVIQSTGFGMNRKLLAASNSLKHDVARVVIANGTLRNPVSAAIRGESGTMIQHVEPALIH